MAFSLKLPRNRYESSWFVLIISVISVNVIAPLITCFEVGFSWRIWQQTLTVLPMIWVVVAASWIGTRTSAGYQCNNSFISGHVIFEFHSMLKWR
ncbi:hypothetical protein [Lactiplantibacillus pentosus]|uniref:hypothetical protein n=1 Tax=Lactiplantibacillus pentosus TaxID=1589 RepID=UPI001CFFE546|nr:hypothetical protein [Lactiplantibacillus pentosus]MCB5221420.1 hypothetical protein [Lactiplantibacillus pentosus]